MPDGITLGDRMKPQGFLYKDYGGLDAIQRGVVVGKVQTYGDSGCKLDNGTVFNPLAEGATLRMPLLYKKNTQGNLMTMEMWVQDGDVLRSTIRENGKVDRAYSSPVKVPPSKTRQVRCIEQLISKWNKKSGRDGWTPEEGGEEPKYHEPMLLHRWDKYYKRMKNWPLIIQPKLDGIRGVHYLQHGEICSRKRDPFPLPHIVGQMKKLGVSGDGELWRRGFLLEDIKGAVTRQEISVPHSELTKEMLEYWLFDRWDKPEWSYADRYSSLFDLDLSETPNIKIVPAMIAHSTAEAELMMKAMVGKGYEGAVACDPTGKYEKNKRVYHRLKMKPVLDGEFRIVYVTDDPDVSFGPLISFICAAENGTQFKVTPAWDKSTRAREFKEPDEKYVGKLLTVEYRERTKGGLPKHAVGKTVREDGI